ncbi:hypothetical protein BV25DRAFT_787629 [Artomyces pyxidatus]|uniref:Uncharacterized protein n=1 Tax=Artomyces pyxidatus TaxID=48021 RepID=A0ACB8SY42_9AGAM|nr:hypothetical protein BV25DRAFT_787629 [Artomyces pyxidatus]
MFRFHVIAFVTVLMHLALLARTAPLQTRQIGNIQCNLDRLNIVLSLAAAKSTAGKLSTALSNSPDASNVQSVTDGISGAQGAIGVIGKALLTGQSAPADARQEVSGNLTIATTALGKISSSDSKVSSTLATAQKQLSDAVDAGNGVIANCK